MSHNKLIEALDDNEGAIKFINEMDNFGGKLPYLIESSLKMLSDDSIYFGIIPDVEKLAIVRMLYMCYNSCYDTFMDIFVIDKTSKDSIDRAIKYGEIEVYKVVGRNGLRDATQKEVEQGVTGLIAENIYPAGREIYQQLNLMMWAFTGENYYFRRAGYQLSYIDSKTIKESLYDLIKMSASGLVPMFKFIGDEEKYNKAIKLLNKTRKNGGYKYATYAQDEIIEDISIKQLVKNVDSIVPRKSDNADYRKAISLIIKTNKNNARLTPLEVSFLRKVYKECAMNNDARSKSEPINDIKLKCERLLNMQYSGLIDPKHFAYTIISTVRKSNYVRCSSKQLSYIDQAIDILDKGNAENLRKMAEVNRNSLVSNTQYPGIMSDDDIDHTLLNDIMVNGIFND